jgi:hypothetical protein
MGARNARPACTVDGQTVCLTRQGYPLCAVKKKAPHERGFKYARIHQGVSIRDFQGVCRAEHDTPSLN